MYLQQIRNATIFYIMAEKNINWSFRASSSSVSYTHLKLITFGNLKDGLIRGTKFDRTAEQKLEKLLQDKEPEKIQKACTSLGAEFTETKADLCAVFPVLPRYPVTLKIWFADEEFPASGKLFLQDHADHYLSVEYAVTVGEILLQKLSEAFSSLWSWIRKLASPALINLSIVVWICCQSLQWLRSISLLMERQPFIWK